MSRSGAAAARRPSCQMRWIVDGAYPVSRDIERVLQCVASRGFSSSVLRTTSATASSSMHRGRPGRGSSWSPSMPCSANRLRHFLAVRLLMPSVAAICTLFSPSAASSTMCARSDTARHTLRPRASRSNSLRSSPVSLISTDGRITVPPESKTSFNYTNYENGTLGFQWSRRSFRRRGAGCGDTAA